MKQRRPNTIISSIPSALPSDSRTSPVLDVPTPDAGHFILGGRSARQFDMVVFYRGLHCPICAKYLLELDRLAPEFQKCGVDIIAISSDDESRGKTMAKKLAQAWFGSALAFPCKLPGGRASTSARGVERPPSASKSPPCSASQASSWSSRTERCTTDRQTMPFARPQFQDLLGAIDYAIAKD